MSKAPHNNQPCLAGRANIGDVLLVEDAPIDQRLYRMLSRPETSHSTTDVLHQYHLYAAINKGVHPLYIGTIARSSFGNHRIGKYWRDYKRDVQNKQNATDESEKEVTKLQNMLRNHAGSGDAETSRQPGTQRWYAIRDDLNGRLGPARKSRDSAREQLRLANAKLQGVLLAQTWLLPHGRLSPEDAGLWTNQDVIRLTNDTGAEYGYWNFAYLVNVPFSHTVKRTNAKMNQSDAEKIRRKQQHLRARGQLLEVYM